MLEKKEAAPEEYSVSALGDRKSSERVNQMLGLTNVYDIRYTDTIYLKTSAIIN